MSAIQITDEISNQLTKLKNAANESINFNRAQQLTFEDNRNLTSIIEYQEAIRKTGRLAQRYQEILIKDIETCQQIITNARTRDHQLAQTIKMI